MSISSSPTRTFPKTPITGTVLKSLAMVTMLIDHLAVVIWPDVTLTATGLWPGSQNVPLAYFLMRLVGRIAFPLFAFLLVEGFWHTHNVRRYAERLVLLGMISEAPYDLALHQTVCDWSSQNIFFTLALALGAIWALDRERRTHPLRAFLLVMVLGLLAEGLHTDYQSFGVGLVVILYVLHDRRMLQSLWGSLLCLFEGPSVIVSFILTGLYSGQRGRGNGYGWYVVYPLHLLGFALVHALLVK